MTIAHIAIRTKNLEKMKDFYVRYFNCIVDENYENEEKGMKSYFLTFGHGTRIELIKYSKDSESKNTEGIGLAHFAISLGSKKRVDEKTEELKNDGYELVNEPRTTGDDYYESIIKDPEGNKIELTV